MSEPILSEAQKALAAYKAEVDAKYATVRERHEATIAKTHGEAQERNRKDSWILVSPEGRMDGFIVRWSCASAVEAFEQFYPYKKDRLKAAAAGWHIEQDDENGSRFDEYAASFGVPKDSAS